MKYKSAFLLFFLAPIEVLAQHHCPAIDSIKQSALIYTAVTVGGEEWSGALHGPIPENKTDITGFSEAFLIIDSDSDKGNAIDQGIFQKCTYNLLAEGKKLDMYYGNKTWLASISGKPHWVYQQTPFLETYRCAGVAAEECKFDILAPNMAP